MAGNGSFNTSNYDGRYLQFIWEISSQSIANNSSTIAWQLVGAGKGGANWYKAGNFKVVIDGKTVYSSSTRITLYEGTVVAKGTYTFNHNSDGSRGFTASAEGAIYTSAVNCKGSGSFTLNAIPRASTINSVGGSKITDTFNVKYTKYASQFTDNLQIAVKGYKASQTITGYQSGEGFKLSEALKKDIYRASQSNTNASVEFLLITMNGSSKVGTSNTITKSIAVNDSLPTIDGISYQDTNGATVAITGDNQKIIRNNSAVSVTITGMSAKNGATLSKLNIKAGDYNKDVSLAGTTSTQTVSIGKLNLASDTVLTATVTDSRGNAAVTSINLTMLDYEKPTAMIDCKRKNNFYTETEIIVNPFISSLDGKNAATVTAQYKQADSTTYGNNTPIVAGETTVLSLDNTKAWNVKVLVADKLNSTSYILFVEKGQPIIFFDRNKSSVGVNCFPVDNEAFEVSGKNIYKALYYQAGDAVEVSDIYCVGNTTSNNTKLYFSIPLAKSLEDVNSISLTEMKLNVRHGNGGYTLSSDYVTGGYNVLGDSSITVTNDIKTGANMVTFVLSKTSAYNGVNNTPETVQVHSVKFTCN